MPKTTTTDILQAKLTIDGKDYVFELKKAGESLEKFDKKASNSFAGIRKSYLAMAGVIVGGAYAAKKVFDFGRAGAQIKDLEFAFRKMGGSAQSLRQLQNAVAGTIDDATLMRMSNMGQTLGINAEQFTKLSEVGKAAAKVLGIDVNYAMESVITGTARQSKLWLDNLGIIVDVEAAQKSYAESINKTADALTEAEKKQAFINATIQQGQEIIGVAGSGAAVDSYDQMAASFVNLGNILKERLNPYVSKLAEYLHGVNQQWIDLLSNTSNITKGTVTVDIPQAMQDQVNRAAAVRARRQREEEIHAQAPTGQISGLGAYLSTTEAETTALLETQQAQLDARVEIEKVSQEERIAAIAQAYDMEQEMAVAQGEALIQIQQVQIESQRALTASKIEAVRAGFQAIATAFPKFKAAAIAEASISGGVAFMNALSVKPWWVGLSQAAVALAKTKQAISAIRSTGISGGGGTSTYTYGGASQNVPTTTGQNLNIQIVNADKLVDRTALAQMFYGGLGEAITASGGVSGGVTIQYVDN